VKLSVPAVELAKAAGVLARVVGEQDSERFPILACARLRARDGKLQLYGTDLSMGVSVSVDCKVDEPGEVAVDAHRLFAIADKMTGTLAMNTPLAGLTIKGGKSRFMLSTHHAADGPAPLALPGSSTGPIELALMTSWQCAPRRQLRLRPSTTRVFT
jgi:DNA polymerase III sliding clamp (beta) subunit (PCNA family)